MKTACIDTDAGHLDVVLEAVDLASVARCGGRVASSTPIVGQRS